MRGKNYNAGLRGGLFEAQHYERMGQAIWLYGWLVLRQTRERDGIGFVLGGRPISYREIEEETGFARKTLERWMQNLRRSRYIETTTAPGGIIVRIHKAKKFARAGGRHAENGFQQVLRETVGNLWKSPAESSPLLKFADPPLKNEEGHPRTCGGADLERSQSASLVGAISSGAIERQIERRPPDHTYLLNEENEKAQPVHRHNLLVDSRKLAQNPCRVSAIAPAKHFAACSTSSKSIYANRTASRAARDEEIARELRVGAGPEIVR